MSGQSEAKVGELQPENQAFATLVAGKRNESLAVLGDNELEVTPLATDQYGRLLLGSLASISAIIPGTGATNLGKAEDAVAGSGDTGVFVLAVRNDANTTLAANGDYIAFNVDSAGRSKNAEAVAEDAAHTSGDLGFMALGVRNDSNTSFGANLDYTPINLDSAGRIKAAETKLEDDAHVSGDPGFMMLGVRNDNNSALSDTDGDYTPIATDSAGRVKLSVVKAEDAAHTSGDTGVPILAVRQDTLAASTDTTGDYANLKTDSEGRLYANTKRETVPRAGNTVAFGSLTNSYATLIASNSYNGRVLSVLIINTTDAFIDISNDSANSIFPVAPDSQYIWDFGANGGGYARTAFQVKYTGAAPTRGSLYFRLQDEN